jgi:hypothetical protein
VNDQDLLTEGFCVTDDFLSGDTCAEFQSDIDRYRNNFPVAGIYRAVRGRPLKYSVIDGLQIQEHLPRIHELLETIRVQISKLSNEKVVPLENPRVACNINITGNGGTYRWHYDRNRFTALLYLNEVEGGETEMYPNYRITLGKSRSSRGQQIADRLLLTPIVRGTLGRHEVVAPQPGRLLIMRGDRCLHSVRPVLSEQDRINVVLSYDSPGRKYEIAKGLDSYLYSSTSISPSDPNYVK